MVCLSGQCFYKILQFSIFSNANFFYTFPPPFPLKHMNCTISMCKDLQTLKPYEMWHYCTHFGFKYMEIIRIFIKRSHILWVF